MTIAPIRLFYATAAGLAAVAGFLLFPLATETERFFSWDIDPPLTAAFLGAAYWAALVLLAWAARQREWAYARTAMPPVATIAALLLVTTLIHLDRFDLDSIFGWFWLIVYCFVTPLLVVLLWRQRAEVRGVGPVDATPQRPVPHALTVVLAAQATILLGFGVALIAAPTDAAEAWPWTLSPLTARAIGSFLLGFAVAGAFALRDGDLHRLRGVAMAWAALGALELLAVAIHADDLNAGAAGTAAYAAFWSSALVLGLAGWVLSRSKAASASAWSR